MSIIKNNLYGLFLLFLFSTGCFALPAPKYLSVDRWHDCVHTVRKGTATYICLPSERTKNCPKKSWIVLKKEHLIDKCP